MKSKEFLKIELNKLFKQFDGIKIRYEFQYNIHLHLIEITPESIYESNECVLVEYDLVEKFENLYEDEAILFISTNSLMSIENVEFSLGY